jgi:hypothetical protein
VKEGKEFLQTEHYAGALQKLATTAALADYMHVVSGLLAGIN